MLKTQRLSAALLLSGLTVLPAAAQVTQKKIATIGPGETIVSQESCLLVGSGPGCATEDFFAVTKSTVGGKTRFFTYDKNGKKGPFDKIAPAMLRNCAEFESPPAYFEDEGSTEGIEESGKSVEFRGKTYGPFQQVQAAAVSPDKTRFYALVVKEGKLRFISSDGRDVPASGMAQSIRLSPDGTKGVAVCTGTLTITDGAQVDLAKIDPNSLDDVYVCPIDGPKLGPFHNDEGFGDVWFVAGSRNWLFNVGPAVYFNGKLLRKFGAQIDKSTFWIDDEKHYAWVEGEEIGFADGAKYPYPVMIRHEKSGGKTVLCWISVQKNGDVVAFQRTL